MSAVIRTTTHSEAHPYVHKLRLEARDGAAVEIKPAVPLKQQAGARIVAKLVGAALAAALVLMLVGNQIVY